MSYQRLPPSFQELPLPTKGAPSYLGLPLPTLGFPFLPGAPPSYQGLPRSYQLRCSLPGTSPSLLGACTGAGTTSLKSCSSCWVSAARVPAQARPPPGRAALPVTQGPAAPGTAGTEPAEQGQVLSKLPLAGHRLALLLLHLCLLSPQLTRDWPSQEGPSRG